MPSPLHKVPLGLLELLRLKTLGRAPDQFSDTVLPTVEALESYAAPELETTSGTAQVGGMVSHSSTITVGTFRWIWGVAGVLTMGAAPGTFVQWEVGFQTPGNAQPFVFGQGELRPIAAAAVIRFGAALPRPMVLRAGTAIFARVNGDGGGVDHTIQVVTPSVASAVLI